MKSFIRRMSEHIKVHLKAGATGIQAMSRKAIRTISRSYALLWHRFYWLRYRLSVWRMRYGTTGILVAIIVLMCGTAYFCSSLQSVLEPLLSAPNTLGDLRSLFLALGGGLNRCNCYRIFPCRIRYAGQCRAHATRVVPES